MCIPAGPDARRGIFLRRPAEDERKEELIMTRRALAAIVVIVSASVLLFIGMGPSLRRPTAWEEAARSGASQESLEGYHSVSVLTKPASSATASRSLRYPVPIMPCSRTAEALS